MLFTTPTLNDALPTTFSEVVADADCFRMYEDDWRQFEFVSSEFAKELKAELKAIDKIWKKKSVPLGEHHAFRKVHVRKAIPQPLNIPFTVSDLEAVFGAKVKPITISGYDKVLVDVYAISLENLIVYAVISDGKLRPLGLEPLGRFVLEDEVAQRFGEFLSKHDLKLVHWRSRTLFDSPAETMNYLRGE
jgi:hypothetical protein